MSKEIKDYIPFYLNEDNPINAVVSMITEPHLQRTIQLTGWNYYSNDKEIYSITPILRQLFDMTEEERKNAVAPMVYGLDSLNGNEKLLQAAELTIYLLKHGFDIFGLIESGLAINNPKPVNK